MKQMVCTYTDERGVEQQVIDGTRPCDQRAIFAYAYARSRIRGANPRMFELERVVLGREVSHEELYKDDPEKDK